MTQKPSGRASNGRVWGHQGQRKPGSQNPSEADADCIFLCQGHHAHRIPATRSNSESTYLQGCPSTFGSVSAGLKTRVVGE